MSKDFQGSSRAGYRAKRKKTNFILNGLIVVVLLLIGFVAYSIFLSGNDKTASKKEVQTTAEKTTAEKQSVKINKDKTSTEKSSTSNQQKEKTKDQSQSDAAKTDTTKGDNSSDQLQTAVTPETPDSSSTAVAPETPGSSSTAATSSNGQHTTNYDSSSADWQQMLAAISAATGVDQGNMTVWFLGSDKGTPNGSVGTISPKDNKQKKYRVNLQWVEGQGWKATNVQQISQ
ncbi:DUF1510 family protein [Bacillus sp. EB600]|uniref:DUF1510 family protein n=1 Tax=Bacillus sp. EB600 TaxID=2806345 RepID=UPI00210E08AD|nr:DUF1510 family protein [Bacillus sp. EB600]MCQ6278190.1 DUF1510 family protein [Bacillus sp. EB600]